MRARVAAEPAHMTALDLGAPALTRPSGPPRNSAPSVGLYSPDRASLLSAGGHVKTRSQPCLSDPNLGAW